MSGHDANLPAARGFGTGVSCSSHGMAVARQDGVGHGRLHHLLALQRGHLLQTVLLDQSVGAELFGGPEPLRVPYLSVWVSRALALTVLVVALSRYAATVRILAPLHVIDDAFITYRYAEHWAAGYGPVWNIGDAPVEGYTCPLYVGVLAAARWAWQVDIPTFSQQVGIITGWATLLALFVIAWWLIGLPYAAIVTSAVAVEPSMAVWAVGGMETTPYALLLVLSAGALALVVQSPAWWPALALCCVLLAEMRTEGLVFTLAVILAYPHRATVKCGIIVGIVLAAHTALRWWYYGALVPLSLVVKQAPFAQEDLLREFLLRLPVHLGLVLIAVCTVRQGHVMLRYGVCATALLLAVLVHVDPVMARFDRYVLPIVPLVCLMAGMGLAAIGERTESFAVPVALLFLAAIVLNEPRRTDALRASLVARIASDSAAIDRQIRMGRWLAAHVADRSTLVAASDCGVLPYYSDLPVLDLAGLNDAHLARDRGDMAYLTARNPGLLVFEDTPATLGGQRLLASGRYVEVPLTGFGNVHLYQRSDLPLG